jgi:mannose-6-phosphate isomerase
MQKIKLLKNVVQEYAWGSRTAIPDLMGQASPADEPQAELWMGAHLKAPSMMQTDAGWDSLANMIEANPVDILGRAVVDRFGPNLPYLFKVLAAEEPLSIQAHPNAAEAEEGFKRENRLGIPLDAPNRNYKDGNHKPECICALIEFWGLCGFRKIADMVSLLKKISPNTLYEEIMLLEQTPDENGMREFFKAIMTLDGQKRADVLAEAVNHAEIYKNESPEFDWTLKLSKAYPSDMGMIFPAILNLVCLQPGEALFLPAGELHAYLQGVGIELMANSDNVLRGGLTPKHIDVPELMRVLNFKEKKLAILKPAPLIEHEYSYQTPAAEFILSTIRLGKGDVYTSPNERGAEILLCTSGDLTIAADKSSEPLNISKGISLLVPASISVYRIEGEGVIYKAAVPI